MHSFLHYVIKRVTTSSPRTPLSALCHETNYVMKRGKLVTVHPLHRGNPELGVLSSQSVHPTATTCMPMLSYSTF